MSKLSEKIRFLIKYNGMTEKKLAEKLCVCESTVQKWVVGKHTPKLNSIIELSQIFRVPVQTLINDEEEVAAYFQRDQANSDFPVLFSEEYNDSVHEIVDADLAKGALLHRFENSSGDKCSAIYVRKYEVWWHYREHEARMIKDWNEEYRNDR